MNWPLYAVALAGCCGMGALCAAKGVQRWKAVVFSTAVMMTFYYVTAGLIG